MTAKISQLKEQLYCKYTKLAMKNVMFKLEKKRQTEELNSLQDDINFIESQIYFAENNFPDENSYSETREEL